MGPGRPRKQRILLLEHAGKLLSLKEGIGSKKG